MQLAAETENQIHASHFVRISKVWAAFADSELSQAKKSNWG